MRVLGLCLLLSAGRAGADEPLTDAREIARWLTSAGRDVEGGRIWPVDPETPEDVVAHLYSGTSGVAEFFLSLHQIRKDREYLDFARRLTADALARSTRDEAGLRFVQAENRSQPELLQAQTGYMRGAAGIGLWLLHLHAFEKGETAGVTLPDSPFEP
jgi:uncharacterized protein YyaL (SSP411 family)